MTLRPYSEDEPGRDAIDALRGPAVIEFGNDWCGHCQAAQPLIAEALAAHPGLRHLKVADGPGRPLGRSFRVKLWPTLVFLADGVEHARVVRPRDAAGLRAAIASVVGPEGRGSTREVAPPAPDETAPR
ncbi:thioredoxin family protein [Quisquiliibacterium transsilvanicum]|uniref:Thioredoxin 1 n=1 Tax=Quisquiliibacterium transsilvanicum TaxID=1549638 RepID=A0A7W8HJV4_9BURK|nr:thioredoxin family protein [Quisquiliibacterium transsilvanicum]MBB5272796.1 thioredoxin 1 [Quisquiliibacterium transsilvanicum]